MDSITVRFEGVCTHITYPYPPKDFPHRVVLAKKWGDLPEHYATLVIPENAASEADVHAFAVGGMRLLEKTYGNYLIGLFGVSLEIGNADRNAPYQLERTFLSYMPRLSKVSRKWFGEPDYVVTEDGRAGEAWAFFNVTSGTFTAGTVYLGAVASQLDCITTGAPILAATAFAADAPASQPLTLPSGTGITLQYVAAPSMDGIADFAIHYHVVRPDLRPNLFETPDLPSGMAKLPPLKVPAPHCSIGPGCSNSIFP